MSTSVSNGPRQRNSPFSRDLQSPSSTPPMTNSRPKSSILSSPPVALSFNSHSRNQSFSPHSALNLLSIQNARPRSISNRSSNQISNTFAPSFIKASELREDNDRVGGIEGENDFSGKRYVWLRDPQTAFAKGWIVEEYENGSLLVQCEDGSVSFRTLVYPYLKATDSNLSYARWTLSKSIKSILQNLTRRTIWLSSRTSMKPLWFTTCIPDTKPI